MMGIYQKTIIYSEPLTLCSSLSDYIKLPVVLVDCWTDNEPDNKSWSICSRIRVPISEVLRTSFIGSLCISLNRGEKVWISADLLLFAGGDRVEAHSLGENEGSDVITLVLEKFPESDGMWTNIGKWKSTGLICSDDMGWESWQSSEGYD